MVSVLAVVLLYIAFYFISSSPKHNQSSLLRKGTSQIPRLDIEGWVLLVLAVFIPLFAVTLGDNVLSWTHPIEILLLVLSPILICSFIWYETRAARDPIVDMTPVSKIQYLAALLQVFGVIFIFNAVSDIKPILLFT